MKYLLMTAVLAQVLRAQLPGAIPPPGPAGDDSPAVPQGNLITFPDPLGGAPVVQDDGSGPEPYYVADHDDPCWYNGDCSRTIATSTRLPRPTSTACPSYCYDTDSDSSDDEDDLPPVYLPSGVLPTDIPAITYAPTAAARVLKQKRPIQGRQVNTDLPDWARPPCPRRCQRPRTSIRTRRPRPTRTPRPYPTTSMAPMPTNETTTYPVYEETTFVTEYSTVVEIVTVDPTVYPPAPTDTIGGLCPAECNPLDPSQNACDGTTSCTTTSGLYPSRYYCACRAGYRADYSPANFERQMRTDNVNTQARVYVGVGVVCDTLCSDPTCSEVVVRPQCV